MSRTSLHLGRRPATIALAVAAVALAGCSTSTPPGSGAGSPAASSTSASPSTGPTPTVGTTLDLAVPDAVSSIELTNQDGQKVTLASLHGKTVVLTDFLTLCQEICPLTSANYGVLQRNVATAGLGNDVVFVEATVDPARDTVARLAAYQKLYGAQPNWEFLTGTEAQIAALWKGFAIDYSKVPGDKPYPTDWLTGKPLLYDVDHQDVVFVLGPDGHRRWLVQGSPDTQGVKPPTTLLKFLNDSGVKNLASPEAPSWTVADVEQGIAYVTGKPIS